MKLSSLIALAGALALVSGCVKTVSESHKTVLHPSLKFFADKYESRYERPVDNVYAAAVEVVKANGILERQTIHDPGTNQVRSIEAKVGKRYVFVRVEAVDPKITSIKVQARTKMGATDQDLTADLQKQIAIKLAAESRG